MLHRLGFLHFLTCPTLAVKRNAKFTSPKTIRYRSATVVLGCKLLFVDLRMALRQHEIVEMGICAVLATHAYIIIILLYFFYFFFNPEKDRNNSTL